LQAREDRPTMMEPQKKNLLRPWRSASLPSGSSMIAAAMMKDEATQLSPSALMEKSEAMAGRATLTEEPRKGVVKELMLVATRTTGNLIFLIMRLLQNYVRGYIFLFNAAKLSLPEAISKERGMTLLACLSMALEMLRMSHWAKWSDLRRAT